MAFCLNLDNFIQEEKSGKTLFVKRTDKELNIEVDYHEVTELENVTVSDWPSFEKEFKQLIKYNPNFLLLVLESFYLKSLIICRYLCRCIASRLKNRKSSRILYGIRN